MKVVGKKVIEDIEELEEVVNRGGRWLKHYFNGLKGAFTLSRKIEYAYKLMKTLASKRMVLSEDLLKELLEV